VVCCCVFCCVFCCVCVSVQGGAVAFNLCTSPQCRGLQRVLSGAVLCAPMVKVSDDLKPPDFVIRLLSVAAQWIPFAPITPIASVLDRCLKDPAALRRAQESTLGYNGLPRLRTALAMLRATQDISGRMQDLSAPLLLLHGGADTVTCPKLSAVLYESCSSEDKTLRIYPGECTALNRISASISS
jgi:caffeoylshikimate esterase